MSRRRYGGNRVQHLPLRCWCNPDLAVEVDTGSGFNLNTVGIILMVGGLLGLLVSVLFWSSFSPWSRRRTVAGDAVLEERRIERDLP